MYPAAAPTLSVCLPVRCRRADHYLDTKARTRFTAPGFLFVRQATSDPAPPFERTMFDGNSGGSRPAENVISPARVGFDSRS